MSRHIRLVEMTKEQEDALFSVLASCQVIRDRRQCVMARRWMLRELPEVMDWLRHHRSTTYKDAPSKWNFLPSEVADRKYGM